MTDQLETAVKTGRVDVVQGFISTLQESKDNDIVLDQIKNKTIFNGETLLHLASKEGQFDIVRALLSHGADPSVPDSQGHSAYQVAISEKTRSVYREVLLQAASQLKLKQVRQLLAAGVEVNFQDTAESGNTPLHWAASFADVDTVECLCKYGGDVLAMNTSGCRPLHDAVVRGNHDIVHCLLKYGADPSLPISSGKYAGKTCYMLAEGKKEVLDVLNHPPTATPVKVAPGPTSLIQTNPSIDNQSTTKTNLTLPNGTIPSADHVTTNPAPPSPPTPSTPQLMSPTFKRAPGIEILTQPPHVVTDEKLGLLWPLPQSVSQREGPGFCPHDILPIFLSAGTGTDLRRIRKKWLLFRENLESLGLNPQVEPLTPLSDQSETNIVCHVSSRLCPRHGSYKITVMENQLKILCHDCETLVYAIATLLQLLNVYRDTSEIHIPQLIIDDWPMMAYRGVLLDISQGRVPNVVTLKETIINLALLKINLLHLYVRYRNQEEVTWQVCYSMEELMELDDFCHEYGIQLVPVLEVAPTVQYEDVSQLYSIFQDLLTCFSYNEFVSVGPRLSSFLLDVGEDNELSMTETSTMLPVRTDQTLQLCGYPLHDLDPRVLSQLPPHLMLSEYGVQATYDYSEFTRPLSSHGVSYFVCPGTAAWNSLAGCPEAALTNVYNAMKCAQEEGALGLIVCNWSGKGHVTHLSFSWPGFLMGAGLSWNNNCHWEYCLSNLEDLLNTHVFCAENGVVGHTVVELGRAETYLLRCARSQAGDDCSDLPAENGSLLYKFLLQPDTAYIENLSPEILQKVTRHIRKCQAELKTVTDLGCKQGASVLAELNHTCDLMLLAVKLGRSLVLAGKNPNPGGPAGLNVVNMGVTNLSPTVKTDHANRLLELLEVYEKLWRDRYLEHGLRFSLGNLQATIRQLIPEDDPRLQHSDDS